MEVNHLKAFFYQPPTHLSIEVFIDFYKKLIASIAQKFKRWEEFTFGK